MGQERKLIPSTGLRLVPLCLPLPPSLLFHARPGKTKIITLKASSLELASQTNAGLQSHRHSINVISVDPFLTS